MNEWITTSQLIDRLRIGQIAELEEGKRIPTKFGPSYKHLTKSVDGDLRWCKDDGSMLSSSPLQIYGHMAAGKWAIKED
ncbi:hypothetical protein B4102_3784 [Heyndrickxia sporothermodurans]|uniref:Uncharacterized protein n=1 Tax=Heyndrickxia sporothermodurans TaxID=46224 RepID=A0A150KL80_9BACI|nr:hypothetical protein [Heyndrickxia sporothermodurans]KYC92243.1 hypothetical protein B4102_3784 [Heyndrickxia sporothermodurans]